MKLKELLKGVEAQNVHAASDIDISGLCIDSRKASKGCAFIALPGFKTDGHLYIGRAVSAGAALVVSERAVKEEVPWVQVPDTHKALSIIADNFYGYPAEKMKMIGVTGTNGKTTTTSLIKTILEQALGTKAGLIGTNWNMIGDTVLEAERTTPDALTLRELFNEMVKAGCTHCVMEVSSHALALGRVDGIVFDVGVFTNLTQDHLDFHITMEEYLKAKAKLFDISRTGVINLDDPAYEFLISGSKSENITYSVGNVIADVVAENVKLKNGKVEFEALTPERIGRIELNIPGMFSVYNALAAITCCLVLGVPLDKISAALKNAKGVMGRVEVVPVKKPYTVIIDYAHTPDALKNVLESFKSFAKGRIVVLFGCGGDRDAAKRPLMGKIACDLSDFVIVTSDNPRTEQPGKIIEDILAGMTGTSTPYVVIENRREAIAWALLNSKENDILLLAGKGHETYQEINGVKHPFDERQVVASCLGQSQ